MESGVPPADIASQPASQPAMQHGQTTHASRYQQQYINQVPQQQGQLQGAVAGHVAQQQPAQMPPTGQQGSQMGAFQQHYAHFGQNMPHGGSQMVQPSAQQPQVAQQPYGAQMLQPTGSQMLAPQGSQMLQHSIQHTPPMASQQAPQPQGPQVGQSQGHHFGPQQMPYGAHHYGPQGVPQGSPFIHQLENTHRLPPHDDSDFSKVKQAEFSMPLVEQSGCVAGQGPPSMNASNHVVQASPVSGQSQSFGLHQPTSSIKLQDGGNNAILSQHGAAYQNQIGQSSMHPQQHGQPPIGSNMGYDDNQQLRAGGRYHPHSNNEAPIMAAQHPKLATIPSARNHQYAELIEPIEKRMKNVEDYIKGEGALQCFPRK